MNPNLRTSKSKLLLNVARDMRTLADSLQALAYDLNQNESPPVVQETPPIPATPEKTPTISDVRAVLSKKVTAEVKALLTKFGVNKLSELDVCKYNQLLVEAEGLPDA